MDVQKRKTAVAGLSVASNSTLVVLKLFIGLAIGSVSVLSEAIHSGVDLLAAVIALVAVRTSGKPADPEHPFGHGKIENISGTVEALLIFLAAAWIIYEAIHKLLKPQPLEWAGWGILVMLVSAVVNYLVSRMLFKVGQETESVALQADAWHLRTDVWTSAGVMAGLSLFWLGQRMYPGVNLQWLDPLAAIAVALLIVHAAYELTVQSARDLLDVNLPAEEVAWIHEYLKGLTVPVRDFHRLRTRKSGSTRFVEFHLHVNPELSVEESHRLAHEITEMIQRHFSGSCDVNIHLEPSSRNEPINVAS